MNKALDPITRQLKSYADIMISPFSAPTDHPDGERFFKFLEVSANDVVTELGDLLKNSPEYTSSYPDPILRANVGIRHRLSRTADMYADAPFSMDMVNRFIDRAWNSDPNGMYVAGNLCSYTTYLECEYLDAALFGAVFATIHVVSENYIPDGKLQGTFETPFQRRFYTPDQVLGLILDKLGKGSFAAMSWTLGPTGPAHTCARHNTYRGVDQSDIDMVMTSLNTRKPAWLKKVAQQVNVHTEETMKDVERLLNQ